MKSSDNHLITTMESEIRKLELHLANVMEDQYSVMRAIRSNIMEKKKFIRDLKARKGGVGKQ